MGGSSSKQKATTHKPSISFTEPKLDNAYRYIPLPDDGKSIRIFQLRSGGYNDDIEVDIIQTSTVAAKDLYEAISYAWDVAPISWKTIQIGKKKKLVTEGVFTALKALRDTHNVRRFWIDQVCINQRDHREVSSQMTIMRHIYGNAQRTLVWLRESQPVDNVVLPLCLACTEFRLNLQEMAVLISPNLDSTKNVTAVMSILLDGMKDSEKVPEQLQYLSSIDIEKIAAFFEHQWFQRLWPVQEIVLSSSQIDLRCGDQEVPWADLGLIAYWLLYSGLVTIPTKCRQEGLQAASSTYMYCMNTKNAFPLVEMLCTSRRFRATKAQDKVFAILGMTEDIQFAGEKVPQLLQIDTALGVVAVYSRIACYLLFRHQNLMAFSCVQHSIPGLKSNSLPTWVADWDKPEMVVPIWTADVPESMLFSAGPPLKSPFGDCVLNEVRVTGFRYNIVERVLDPILPTDISAMKDQKPGSGYRLFQWIANMAQILPITNKSSETKSTHFWSQAFTLTTGRKATGELVERQKVTGTYSTLPAVLEHTQAYCAFVSGLSHEFCGISKELRPSFATLQQQMKKHAQDRDSADIADSISRYCANRTLFYTSAGGWGLGPTVTKSGDMICILEGGKVPFLLRPNQNGTGYHLVGECYMTTVMNGEACSMWETGTPEVFDLV